MPLTSKAVKIRLRSINNTKKITRAMEMVSAAKMRRATRAVLSARPYALHAWHLLMRLTKVVNNKVHPLITNRSEIKSVALVLITANRGLCGGFNQQAITTGMNYANKLKEIYGDVKIDWLVLGKKGAEYLVRTKQDLTAEYEKPDVVTDASVVTGISADLIKKYLKGDYDLVSLIYTDYYSALLQKPRIKTILPLSLEYDPELGGVANHYKEQETTIHDVNEYIFEPSADSLLDNLLPRFLEIQLYQALLESNASEYSARMMAMKNASSSASDMIDDLTLTFNQLRQASITREIAEISGGRVALGL